MAIVIGLLLSISLFIAGERVKDVHKKRHTVGSEKL